MHRAEAPYWVTFEWPNRRQAWNVTTLGQALAAFWSDGELEPPGRRAISDRSGLLIAEELNIAGPMYSFYMTRELMRAVRDAVMHTHSIPIGSRMEEMMEGLALLTQTNRVDDGGW